MKQGMIGTTQKRTKANFVKYLNLNSPPVTEPLKWIVGGVALKPKVNSYGSLIRRLCPEEFEFMFKQWSRYKIVKK